MNWLRGWDLNPRSTTHRILSPAPLTILGNLALLIEEGLERGTTTYPGIAYIMQNITEETIPFFIRNNLTQYSPKGGEL